jgi:glutamate decarboxylase
MEEEAEKLMVEAFSKNFIDYEEYPVSADIQNRCVSMIARLFKDYSRPNIIMNSAVQVCWEKAARYFDVEEKYVFGTAFGFLDTHPDCSIFSDTSFAPKIALSLTLKRL